MRRAKKEVPHRQCAQKEVRLWNTWQPWTKAMVETLKQRLEKAQAQMYSYEEDMSTMSDEIIDIYMEMLSPVRAAMCAAQQAFCAEVSLADDEVAEDDEWKLEGVVRHMEDAVREFELSPRP